MPNVSSIPFAWSTALLDLFAGPADDPIDGRAPDVGGPWTANFGFAPAIDGAGGMYNANGVGAPFYIPCAQTPLLATAAQYLTGTVARLEATGNTEWAGIGLRVTPDGDPLTAIFLLWESDTAAVQLYKVLNDVATIPATYAFPLAAGASLGLQLFVQGTTVTPIVGGVPRTPVTIAGVAGPGQAAAITDSIVPSDSTHGTHLRAFLAATQ